MREFQKRINELAIVPFEQWREHGVKLVAVSANADGRVNSGLTSRWYFYRRGEEFLVEPR